MTWRCWFGHDWTPWAAFKWLSGGAKCYRHCKRCDKHEWQIRP
jgi:hypothetical protein